MSDVKRYDPEGYDGLSALMRETEYGDWVRGEDYDALVAERDGLVAERDGLREDLDECDGDRWKLRAERDQLRTGNERLRSTLKDPEAVLVNMLRGEIAIPSVRSWSKLFGQVLNDEDQRLLEIARLRAENVMLTGTAERQAISIAGLRARITELEQRPTPEAYEAACQALWRHRSLAAELERDAARYRWLRDKAVDADGVYPMVSLTDDCGDQVSNWLFGEAVDRAIDAAMAAQQDGEGWCDD